MPEKEAQIELFANLTAPNRPYYSKHMVLGRRGTIKGAFWLVLPYFCRFGRENRYFFWGTLTRLKPSS
jgi:hypothetical protein